MRPEPVGGSIRITQRPDQGLRAGDLVVVNVIKRLDAGKWAVGIGGRVYPAASKLPLQPGATLRARVETAAGRLVLTVSDVIPDAVRAALERQGLPAGGDAEVIARALARSGLPLLGETIQKAQALLSRSGMDLRKGARAAATLADRGIDLGSAAARALLPVLGFGDKGGDDPRRYRGRQLPDTRHGVKEFAASLPARPNARSSALQAYNHIQGRSQTWVVIPFVFTAGSERFGGTLKIRYDPFRERPLAFTLAMEGVSFHLPLEGSKRTLLIFCDGEPLRRAVARGLDSLKAKFHNMGLEVDDTVYEGGSFDGFSPIEEGMGLPSVDTVG